MTTLPALELLPTGERVTVPVPLPPPCARGSVVVALSLTRGGSAVHPTLERTLVWQRGEPVPALTVFARDLRAAFPRGGRAWLVVRYAGEVIGTGPITVAP